MSSSRFWEGLFDLSFGEGILLVALLLGICAVFVAAEVAFLATGRARARQLAQEGLTSGRIVLSLLQRPAWLFSAILVMITFTQYGAEAVATYVSREKTAVAGAEFVALPIVILVTLVFAEVVPMVITVRNPARVARRLAALVRLTVWLLVPVTAVLTAVASVAVRLVGARPRWEPTATEEDLKSIIALSEQQGFLKEDEEQMLQAVFRFADREVREIMVPRTDMVIASSRQPLVEVLRLMVERNLSRIPMYEGDIDHVIGIVHSKDLLMPLREGKEDMPAAELIRPATFVTSHQRVQDVVKQLQRERRLIAIVTDEFGGTEGLVTMEDALEELVGDIFDEYDVEKHAVLVAGERTYVVSGGLPIHELNERLPLDVPEQAGYATVGGLVCSLAGRVPQAGEAFSLQGVRFLVEKADSKRVRQVRVALPPPPEEE